MWVSIVLGLVLGSCAPGVLGCFLRFTRSRRRAKSMTTIRLGRLVIIVLSLGSILLLGRILERINIGRGPQGDAALWAFTLSFVCVGALAIGSEIKWRRSVGLRDKKLMSLR
jgi:hypothetical protein